jgi:transcriptional regulator with XRE-family HTH domain
MDTVGIGRRMREIRKRSGMTGEQFGGFLQVGKAAVSAWENGRNDPPSSAVLLLAERGKVTTDYILRAATPDSLDGTEQDLLRLFRRRKPSAQLTLLQLAAELGGSDSDPPPSTTAGAPNGHHTER